MTDNAPSSTESQPNWRSTVIWALALALLATVVNGFHCWSIQRERVAQGANAWPLDLDGWGHRIDELKNNQGRFGTLLNSPSVWKGPIVPFCFGLAYYLAPIDEAPLVLNNVAFAVAVALLFVAFRLLKIGTLPAAAALVLWIGYIPNKHIFGCYFAEPLLSFFSALLFLLAVIALRKPNVVLLFVCGAASGVLLLSRAPFFLVLVALTVFLWLHLKDRRLKLMAAFVLGGMVTFLPWTVRNYLVFDAFIPFTTEGGKIVFHGTYLPGDAAETNTVRATCPEVVAMEAEDKGRTPVESYRYWRSLARQQVVENPAGQLRLVVRKTIRFWMYLPQHSWVPGWKTALVALICLPLALLGVVTGYRNPAVELAAIWVLGLWAFHGLVHAELRYNMPVLPMLFLLATLGVQWIVATFVKQVHTVTQQAA